MHMNAAERIKEKAISLGVDLAGVAGVSRFADAPAGKRPQDILPSAKSVIVFGVRILDGVMETLIKAFESQDKSIQGLFGTWGCTTIPSFHLGNVTMTLAKFIEENYDAIAVPTTSGAFQTRSAFSQRRAAVAAGLGQMGWMGRVLTKDFGPRIVWGSVITDLELAEDPLYSGPPLCEPEKCGYKCAAVCPVNAIPGSMEESAGYSVAGIPQMLGDIDYNRCKCACLGFVQVIGQKTAAVAHSDGYTSNANVRKIEYGRVDITRRMSDEEFREIFDTTPCESAGQALQAFPNWKCSVCLGYCPQGGRDEKFGGIDYQFHYRKPVPIPEKDAVTTYDGIKMKNTTGKEDP